MINQQISPRIRHESTLETPISKKNVNRRVTFHPDSTKIPKPAVTQSKRKTVNISLGDGGIFIPVSNLSKEQKRQQIIESSRDNTKRLAYQQGPSRATKLDVKRSKEVIESEQDTPSTSSLTQLTTKTSTKTQSSQKLSSPLHNLVVGAKSKSNLNKEKEEKSKQGHLRAIIGPNPQIFFTTLKISASTYLIAPAVTADNPYQKLTDLKLLSRNESKGHKIQLASLLSFEDKKNYRFVYSLVTKMSKNQPISKNVILTCLLSLRRHVQNNEVNQLTISQIDCESDSRNWPIVCKMILETFRNVKLEDIYIHIESENNYWFDIKRSQS